MVLENVHLSLTCIVILEALVFEDVLFKPVFIHPNLLHVI